jgi:hypothetical protein
VQSGSGRVLLRSSILADTSGGNPDCRGAVAGQSTALVETSGGCDIGQARKGDPQLGPLKDNGGPTKTMALGDESEALDVGVDLLDVGTDQRGEGFARVIGPRADAGAYESPVVVTLTVTPVDFGAVQAGSSVLRTATVTNTGDRLSARLSAASVDGLGFSIPEDGDGCVNKRLAPNGSCTITIAFAAIGGAGARSGRLFIGDEVGRAETATLAASVIGAASTGGDDSNAPAGPTAGDTGGGTSGGNLGGGDAGGGGGGGGGAATTCATISAAPTSTLRTAAVSVQGRTRARLVGPPASQLSVQDRPATWRVVVTGPRRGVRSVAFALDGRALTARGGSVTIDPKPLRAGDHRLVATIVPRRGKRKQLTLSFTVRECRSALLAARHSMRRARTYTDATLTASSGAARIGGATLTLPANTGAGERLVRLRQGTRLGRLTIGSTRHELRLGAMVRGTRPVTLSNRDGVRVTIARRGGAATVTVTGIQSEASELRLQISGRATKLIRNPRKGAVRYSGTLRDQSGAQANVAAAVSAVAAKKKR